LEIGLKNIDPIKGIFIKNEKNQMKISGSNRLLPYKSNEELHIISSFK